MVTHVLVPHDGSDCADRGVERALERYPDGRVTVLRVVDPVSHPGLDGSDAPLDVPLESTATGAADVTPNPASPNRAEAVRTVVEPGVPAPTIVEYAAEHDTDAIVMGTRDRGPVSRLVFGSVSGTVADLAPVPVQRVSG